MKTGTRTKHEGDANGKKGNSTILSSIFSPAQFLVEYSHALPDACNVYTNVHGKLMLSEVDSAPEIPVLK